MKNIPLVDLKGQYRKIKEEVDEVEEVLHDKPAELAEELGDLMFAVVNLCRHAKQDPEALLRAANQKFTKRFQQVESLAQANNGQLQDYSIDELEAFWQQVKSAEK